MNGKLEDVRFIGDITLDNNYSVRMGVSIGDEFNFRGRISCMQVYDVALLPEQRGKSERTGHATSFRIVFFFFVPLIRNIFRSENCPEVMEIASRFICMTK